MTDFSNFHNATVAKFTPADRPNRAPDFVSKGGSVYWDTGEGVIRASDHWVGLQGCANQRSCKWSLEGLEDNLSFEQAIEIIARLGGEEAAAKALNCSINTLKKITTREVKKVSASISVALRQAAGVKVYTGYCAYADFEA